MLFTKNRDKEFLQHFQTHIEDFLLPAAEEMVEFLKNGGDIGVHRKRMNDLEHGGDEVTRIVHEKHRSTSELELQKFSPANLIELISRLDDTLDAIDSVSWRWKAYHLKCAPVDWRQDAAQQIAEIICEMAKRLSQMINGLFNINSATASELTREIKHYEERADTILKKVIEDLYEKEPDAKMVLRWEHIFEILERVTDKAQDVADIASGIVQQRERS